MEYELISTKPAHSNAEDIAQDLAEAWWSYMRQKQLTPQRLELRGGDVDESEKDGKRCVERIELITD